MISLAKHLCWEFCHEVYESQAADATGDTHQPEYFIVNLDYQSLMALCALLVQLGYSCTNTIHHGHAHVIAKFELASQIA